MSYFKQLNNYTGWATFAIATLVYWLTVEPTASFWDCGEFIAASYKLQVPHPPGAPFFLLVNRMFSMLALGEVTQVAYWINISSVLCSGFTILFLFWSITLLGAKFFNDDLNQLTKSQTHLLLGAGLVGALAFAFSDSFWFSAVEAEVYAMSSFFIALIFWAMLKWEQVKDEQTANKWLVFIAYMIGLSIGVHLLNLVAIPALGLIYYYKKNKETSTKGLLITLAISGALILIVMLGIIPGLPSIAGSFEIFFTNSLGLPFGTGISVFILLFLGAIIYALFYSIRTKNVVLNTAVVSFIFVLIGYTSYGIVLVRSDYNPPIDENNPENIISFVSYLKREQYGDRPLFFGHTFASSLRDQQKGAAMYKKDEQAGKYFVYDRKLKNIYDREMLFPRVHSRDPNHKVMYRNLLGLTENERPSMGDNIYFLLSRQLSHYYLRYFMWNFAGRESDIQNSGALSPFSSTKDVPELLVQNKARNQYYALPLLLGLFGLVFSFLRNKRVFLIISLLFFLTGIALILYLNPPPIEPRERDYIYVGSFYAFALWIGFGVIAAAEFMQGFLKNNKLTPFLATTLCLAVPAIMIAENWDDHDRSGRYHSVDSARNLLNSCAPNAILFTGGDNDTFPLWYVQEVEGFRTDVRVCNLSLLGTDWYVAQMKQRTYESAPLPISLQEPQYRQGTNDQITYYPYPYGTEQQADQIAKSGINLKEYLKYIAEDNKYVKIPYNETDSLTFYPSKIFRLPIDKQAVLKAGFVPKEMEDYIAPELVWDIQRNDLFKDDLIILDIIAQNNWQRPVYFSSTLGNSDYLNLQSYFQQEGLAYRLMPVRLGEPTQSGNVDIFVNTDIMYDNMMKEKTVQINGKPFKKHMYWRNLDDPNIYYDEIYQRFTYHARNGYAALARQLLFEGKKEKAKEVVLHSLKVIPDEAIPYDIHNTQMIPVLLEVGEGKRALRLSEILGKRAEEMIDYYISQRNFNNRELTQNLYILNQIEIWLRNAKQTKEAQKYAAILKKYEGIL